MTAVANDQDRRELGAEIRSARKARKMTQQQLAAAAHISLRTVASIERGEHATQSGNVEAVLRVLDLDVDAERARSNWPAEVTVFLDMMGAYLSSLPESQRLTRIGEIVRRELYRPPDNGTTSGPR